MNEEDTPTGAQHRFIVQTPCDSEARPPIVVVGPVQSVSEASIAHKGNTGRQRIRRIALQRVARAQTHPCRLHRIVPRKIDQRDAVMRLVISGFQFVANAVITVSFEVTFH